MSTPRTILRKYNVGCGQSGIPPYRIFDIAQRVFYYLNYDGVLAFMNRMEKQNAYGKYVVGLAKKPSRSGYFHDGSCYYNHIVPLRNKEKLCEVFDINILIYEAFKYIVPYKKQSKYGYRLFDDFNFAKVN